METGNILSADVLDIIFDTRNKDYGAYELRKHYRSRLYRALLLTCLLAVLACLTYAWLRTVKPQAGLPLISPDIILQPAFRESLPSLPVPPKANVLPAAKMQFQGPPLIVKIDPPEEEKPREQDHFLSGPPGDAYPGESHGNGEGQAPIAAPKDIAGPPEKKSDEEKIWIEVEIPSRYPGGMPAWAAFLSHNMLYPQQAIDEKQQGTVVIRFVVDTAGNLSQAEAVSGPEILRAAALAVIRKSGKWEPAIQNGHKVRSYKQQPIVFRLSDE